MTKPRLNLLSLEDRCTPASFAGNVITLDDGGEQLTISTDTSGEYILSSTVDVNGSFDPVVFTPDGPVSIVDSTGSSSVLFANSTAVYAHDFSVELNDGSLGVRFDGATDFGAKNLSVTVDRNIAVNPLAIISTTTGNIDFAANLQPAARIGEFIGVDVHGQVTSTGSGTVSARGRGGLLNIYGMFGVQVLGTAAMISSGTGSLTVTGTGGGGSGDANIGVHVAEGGNITSTSNLEVTVTGNGGGGVGQGNYGVLVQNAGAGITSDGGDVIVNGTAGDNGTKAYGVGVYVNDGGRITAGLGKNIGQQIFLTGNGGGTGTSAHNNGVFVVGVGSNVTSGSGAVTLQGTGGGGSGGGSAGVHFAEGATMTSLNTITLTGIGGNGTGSHNVGVMVQGTGTALTMSNSQSKIEGTVGAKSNSFGIGVMVYNGGKIDSKSSGSVSVKGTGQGDSNNYGIFVSSNGSEISSNNGVDLEGIALKNGIFATNAVFITEGGKVSGGATGQVSIIADAFGAEGANSIAAGTVLLTPRTSGLPIRLGMGFDVLSTPLALELGTNDFAAITADNLVIMGRDRSEIRINATLNSGPSQAVQLVTGGDIISERNTRLNVGTGQLILNAGGFIRPPQSNTGFQTFSAGSVTLAPDSKVELPINGIIPDQYAHLDVSAMLDLSNATVTLSGNYVPAVGNVFTLVTAGNLTGTFANSPDNTVVVFNGVSLRINYTATSVTATVV